MFGPKAGRWRLAKPRLAILVVALVPVSPLLCRADTYPRQPGVDALHYTFRLGLADDTDEIEGQATVLLAFTQPDLNECALDLATAAGGKGMTVSEVTCAGAAVRFVHRVDRLRLTLEPAPRPGEQRAFVIRYRGVPAGGLRIGKNKHGERTFFSENWPDRARQWLPMIDHPYDKATSEFLVTAPVKYQVVANGLLQEVVDLGDGRRLTHWKQAVPIASWLNALGVAQFAVHHAGSVRGVPLQTWVYHQDEQAGITAFETPARQALEFYSERVGPFSYEKLANVEAAGLTGGTEHASAIFYGEAAVRGRPATNLVAHEVAHQWFGDAVTESDWDDVWLSEGFATYFAMLCVEHYQGREAFVSALKRSRKIALDAEKRLRGQAIIHDDLSDTRKILNPLVYEKAAWTLHMLRGQVGTDAFWAGIRDYYARFRDRNATTDDFRRAMEQSAHTDLAWFFQQWLRRPESPRLEAVWSHDGPKKLLILEVDQAQPGEAYRLPLEVGITAPGENRPRIGKVELTERHQRFEIPCDEAPAAVVLDPNTWALMEAKLERR